MTLWSHGLAWVTPLLQPLPGSASFKMLPLCRCTPVKPVYLAIQWCGEVENRKFCIGLGLQCWYFKLLELVLVIVLWLSYCYFFVRLSLTAMGADRLHQGLNQCPFSPCHSAASRWKNMYSSPSSTEAGSSGSGLISPGYYKSTNKSLLTCGSSGMAWH